MNKNGQTNKTDKPKQTNGHHRNNLLQWRTDTQHMPDFNRGKQAKKVTEENTQHANVKQNTAGTQLLFLQQLTGTGFPAVLLTVVTDPAADEQNDHGHVRVNTKRQ